MAPVSPSHKILLAGVSALAINGILSGNVWGADCGTISVNSTISGNCTGELTWTGGRLSIGGKISGNSGVWAASSLGLGTFSNSGTISVSNDGILNTGSISTLSNSGLISGAIGIDVYGGGSAITALSNNSGGTIIGSIASRNNATAAGILNYGNIGALTNSGVISAAVGSGSGNLVAGVFNLGTIGTITNSGAISASGGSGSANVVAGILNAIAHGSSSSLIAAVVNSGVISSEQYGVYNKGGTIGSIVNNSGGTITGSIAGIANVSSTDFGCTSNCTTFVGSIGAITNNGTIAGANYAIYNSGGSIGLITNSGLISGNIYSSSDLTVSGGSGTVGTLSGGGIVASGVSFTGGTLALSDNITVNSGSGTVSNFGAALDLSSAVSISGNYSQSSGTLALGTAGELVVTGAANISGGTVSASLSSTGNYLAGDSRTLVSASSLTNGATVSITGVTGLADSITTNGGSLLVSYLNDYIGGSLPSFANSGTLSGVATGVYVASTGSLGALSNSGTLCGTDYAIYNAGSLGLITDSGLIGGNIYSGRDLSIAGGSGSYGTLSGGTITAPNVSLTSGDLWLLDDIAGNLISSATVKLSGAVSVSGSYTQSGGSLVIVTSNSGSSYGYLTVSGAATVTGTGVTISGGGLSTGETFTIVRSSASGSYSNDTASVNGSSGLSATVSTSGDDLVITLATCSTCTATSTTYRTLGQTAGGNAGAIGTALDTLASSSISPDMQSILSTINGLTSAAGAQAIKELAPAQSTPASQMAFTASQLASDAVARHQQTAMAFDAATGKAAGSDAYQRALWGQVLGGGAIRGGDAEADGYRMKEFGLATGVDHRIADNLMSGVALSWVRAYASGGETSARNATLDSYMLTSYGAYHLGQVFFDGQAGVGYNQFHQKRGITFLGRTATADFGGEHYHLRGRAGYDIPVGGGVTATPLAGLTFLRSVTEGYTETGAGVADLTVKRQGASNLAHDIGGKVSWSLDTGLGRLKPEVRAEWVHDYRQAAITTSGSLDGAAFASSTPRNSPDGAQIGLAATLDGTDTLSFRTEYDAELRSNYQSHTGMLKLIWGF